MNTTFPTFSNGFGINTNPSFLGGFNPWTPGLNNGFGGFNGLNGLNGLSNGFVGFNGLNAFNGLNNPFASPFNSINPLAYGWNNPGWNIASPFGMSGFGGATPVNGFNPFLNNSFNTPFNSVPTGFGLNSPSPFGANPFAYGYSNGSVSTMLPYGSPVNAWSNGFNPNFINTTGGVPTNGFTNSINTSNLYGAQTGVPTSGVNGTPYTNTIPYSPFGVAPATCAHAA